MMLWIRTYSLNSTLREIIACLGSDCLLREKSIAVVAAMLKVRTRKSSGWLDGCVENEEAATGDLLQTVRVRQKI